MKHAFRYTRLVAAMPIAADASAEAAAATAARQILLAQYPVQKAMIEDAYIENSIKPVR